MAKRDTIKASGLEFECHFSGLESDDLIIFLHGFPESSFMWIKLMDEMALNGYYCVAPDLRGYSPKARPSDTDSYQMKFLREDVIQIADALGRDRFHLVGHDWGAFIGWNTAAHYPNRIISWTALSIPHPGAFAKALKENKKQRKKSSYIKYFMIPYLSEWFIRRKDFKSFKKLWRKAEPEEQAYNMAIFKGKGALTASLNYYRANLGKGKSEKIENITVPTLFIWGQHDLAVSEYAAELNSEYVSGPYQFLALDSGHWLMQSSYEDVKIAIAKHIRNQSGKN